MHLTAEERRILKVHKSDYQLAYRDVGGLILQKRLVNLGLLFQTGSDAFGITDKGLEYLIDHPVY